jgi:hypothetical protein
MEVIGGGQHDHINLMIRQGVFHVSEGLNAKAMPNLLPGLNSTAHDSVKPETGCQGKQWGMKVAAGISIADDDHIGGVHVVSLLPARLDNLTAWKWLACFVTATRSPIHCSIGARVKQMIAWPRL